MNYSEQLKDKRWLARRVDILMRDKHRCKMCGYLGPKVNVHHLRYSGMAWESPDEDLITLCSECHRTVHMPEIGERKLEAMRVGYWLKLLLDDGKEIH